MVLPVTVVDIFNRIDTISLGALKHWFYKFGKRPLLLAIKSGYLNKPYNGFTYAVMVKGFKYIPGEEEDIVDTKTDELNRTTQQLLYPNPAKETLYFNTPIDEVTVYNASGSIMKHIKMDVSFNAININDLPQGSYIVKMRRDNMEIIDSLIKQ